MPGGDAGAGAGACGSGLLPTALLGSRALDASRFSLFDCPHCGKRQICTTPPSELGFHGLAFTCRDCGGRVQIHDKGKKLAVVGMRVAGALVPLVGPGLEIMDAAATGSGWGMAKGSLKLLADLAVLGIAGAASAATESIGSAADVAEFTLDSAAHVLDVLEPLSEGDWRSGVFAGVCVLAGIACGVVGLNASSAAAAAAGEAEAGAGAGAGAAAATRSLAQQYAHAKASVRQLASAAKRRGMQLVQGEAGEAGEAGATVARLAGEAGAAAGAAAAQLLQEDAGVVAGAAAEATAAAAQLAGEAATLTQAAAAAAEAAAAATPLAEAAAAAATPLAEAAAAAATPLAEAAAAAANDVRELAMGAAALGALDEAAVAELGSLAEKVSEALFAAKGPKGELLLLQAGAPPELADLLDAVLDAAAAPTNVIARPRSW